MKSHSLLQLEIAQLQQELQTLHHTFPEDQNKIDKLTTKLARKATQYTVARRRFLKRIARTLQLKPDVYGPQGRIYSFQAKWRASDNGLLMHGDTPYDLTSLSDGNGGPIDDQSNL